MAQYKTPGVYIVEQNAFPNSVVEVATAVPAFIGHTQIADYKGSSLTRKALRISSMAEFEVHFGGPPLPVFSFARSARADDADFSAVAPQAVSEPAKKTSEDASADAAAEAGGDETAEKKPDPASTPGANSAAQPVDLQAAAAAATDSAREKRAAANLAKTALDEAVAAEKEEKAKDYEAKDKAATEAETAAVIAAAPANAERLRKERARPSAPYKLTRPDGRHLLYHSMKLFFQNGGGACYIVSVGDYAARPDADAMLAGIDVLLKEQEPTMLVIPEAVLLDDSADCYKLQQQMLSHCGYRMKSRFAILDVYDGDKELGDGPVNAFREGVGANFLAFGAAYYPWVNTSIVSAKELDFTCFDADSRAALKDMLSNDLAGALYADPTKSAARIKSGQVQAVLDELDKIAEPGADPVLRAQQTATVHNTLAAISPLYSRILLAVQRRINLMPPGAAMAGIYTMVDNTRGVWKAPANVSLASVVSPAVDITHDDQEDLNVSTNGKSINAIRTFIGEGTLVWGARTLDGNSLDWRYINVRRTMIMLEESLRLASKAYVFEPNVANTWVTIKSMARNFLTGIWKRGGLAGASPDDAFSVAVGLNETMTPEDILEGILRVTVLVAISRPAEFIEITFQQQMQKS